MKTPRAKGPVAAKAPATEIPELRPGQSVELLKELHILTRDGRLNQDSRRKLKQVSHLFQFIEPLLEEFSAQGHAPLLAGHDLGLMSEAGCPAVADPGALLVRRAHELGITVKPMVGPSSLLLALMASGLDGQRFAFHGYLPAREPDRSRRIAELEAESARQGQTQIFIETPYRNLALFAALLAACKPATRLCVASDLSLASETVASRRIRDWKPLPPPALDKRPTVFLILAA